MKWPVHSENGKFIREAAGKDSYPQINWKYLKKNIKVYRRLVHRKTDLNPQ